MEERRPEREEEHSLLNLMFTSELLSWLLKSTMVKYIKFCFHSHLPSLERGQGTNGLEIPLSILGPPSKCHTAWEENGWQSEGETPSICPSIDAQILLPSDIHSPSPLPHLGGRSLGSAGIPGGRGTGRWVPAARGAPPASPTLPLHAQERKKKSAGKGGRQVLLSGSLVSMATGSALLQLLTPQSLCHPIFSWKKIKERGKVEGVSRGESWETFLVFTERRLIRMQPCLAFNHKVNPPCGGLLWDSSDLMHSQVPYLLRPWSSMQARQPSHPPVSTQSSWAVNLTLALKLEGARAFGTWEKTCPLLQPYTMKWWWSSQQHFVNSLV